MPPGGAIWMSGDSADLTLMRIFTPISGLAPLYAIYTYLTAEAARPVMTEVGV